MFQRWAVGLAAGARTGAVGVLERNARCRLAERNCERGNSLTHEIIRTVYKGVRMHLRELEMDAEEADGRQRAWETTQSAMCLQGKRENLGSMPVTHLCKKLGLGVRAWSCRTGVAETGGSLELSVQ